MFVRRVLNCVQRNRKIKMASNKRSAKTDSFEDQKPSSAKQMKLDMFVKGKSSTTKLPAGTKKEDFEFFWKEESPFSQFHPAVFTVDGVKYNCAEQYMMHQKALTFKDDENAKAIMKAAKAFSQKKLGRKVRNFVPDIWSAKCVDVVKKGNIAKFSQNSHLRKKLLDTYPKIMVEASPMDRIWGIGLASGNKLAWNKNTWKGKNLLGYALTDVRQTLMNSENKNKESSSDDGNSDTIEDDTSTDEN
ncbi:riboflavin biosynthesis protein PYRR, chloroplastic-like [Pecten maximus]|uniref:riboflavin biosynthesis protein PYRR, chloroplastic-like n=1 Tax=Pecten maximus TaxID=6579 RepID=UPI001457E94C|nr:riboflavin biosynthesis protein PYRR, chloroplastic-like [Pecten maximus]